MSAYMLPPELWLEIMTYLPVADLCRMCCVCWSMYNTASHPFLWSGVKIQPSKIQDSGIQTISGINRFRMLAKLVLSGVNFTANQLNGIFGWITSSNLKEASFEGADLSCVCGHLLSSSISSLRAVNLRCTTLTTSQIISVLTACQSSPTLTSLSLYSVDLSIIPPDILAPAVAKLSQCDLGYTSLSPTQSSQLLVSAGNLQHVNLEGVDLSSVPALALAGAMTRLSSVNLRCSRLTTSQCIHLLTSAVTSDTVEAINLARVDLSSVPPAVVSGAVCNLKSASLRNTLMTPSQCSHLLGEILTSRTRKLKDLNLEDVSLREVSCSALAEAVSRLSTVNLRFTDLTTGQCSALLQTAVNSTTLKLLDIRDVWNFWKTSKKLIDHAKLRFDIIY